jgi:ribosomal protein L24E
MSRDDPYHDRKPYHMAKFVRKDGAVSPLCANKPRKLNLAREMWTLRKEWVRCKKCLARLAELTTEPPCPTP